MARPGTDTALAYDALATSWRRPSVRAETIFHVDDPGDALFILTAGHVKITIPPDDGSEPAILTTIGPGGFFGNSPCSTAPHVRRPLSRLTSPRPISCAVTSSIASSILSRRFAGRSSRHSQPRSAD